MIPRAALLHLSTTVFALLLSAARGEAPNDNNLKTPVTGLWLMGQSLCDGSESLPLVTTADPGWGNYSFKRGVRTWIYGDHGAKPEERPVDQFALVPLRAAVNGGLGETIASGLADHLKATLIASPD